MMVWWFIGYVVLLLIMLIVFVVSLMGIYLICSSLGERWAPPVRVSGKLKDAVLAELAKILEKANKPQKVVDLGSGWGTLLIPLAQKFPQHKFVGIERAWTPFYVSKFRARKLSNLSFVCEDFFKYSLKDADVVVMFLIGFMMPKVTDKCLKELPKGATVLAIRFPLTGIEADTVINFGSKMDTYYVYQI